MSARSDAKAVGQKYYFTGNPCPKGHVAERLTSSGGCKVCLNERSLAYQRKLIKENPEKKKAIAAAHYERRKDHIKARVRANYKAEPEKHREAAREYAAEHRVEARERAIKWRGENPERKSAADRQWRSKNRGMVNSYQSAYRAARLNATPPWLTKDDYNKIVEFYKLAKTLSERTGIEHEVDHIVPLQGKTVCGLHVPWNLRAIPMEDNNRRSRIWNEKKNAADDIEAYYARHPHLR